MTIQILSIAMLLLAHIFIGIKGRIPLPNNMTTVQNQTQDNDLFNMLHYKLESYVKVLNRIDESIQNLQEKSHHWIIFRHNIEAWNSQMKVLEQKLDAISRSQDGEHGFGVKLTSFETTLNEILNKFMLLSMEKCQRNSMPNSLDELMERDTSQSLIKDINKATNNLKKTQNDAIARLNNILRYVQNLEQRSVLAVKSETADTYLDTEENLMNWQERLITLANLSQKEMKQMQEQTKKQNKNLENVTKIVGNIQKKVIQWHDNGENNINYMTKQCQSATKELTTFTESSDLLLKRIEYLVLDLYEKFNTFQPDASKLLPIDDDTFKATKPNKISLQGGVTKLNELNFIWPTKENCHELEQRVDGIYYFKTPVRNLAGRDFYERLCIFHETGKAWTVIQNRGAYLEQENFNRSWSDYRLGFGNLHKDFWFGNEFLQLLTKDVDYELRIEMQDIDDHKTWAEYGIFHIQSEAENYKLLIGEHSGPAEDAMSFHNEMDFSTFDHANDECAVVYGAGWWFNSCIEANLNGVYVNEAKENKALGIKWKDNAPLLKSVRLLMRPKILDDVTDSTEDLTQLV